MLECVADKQTTTQYLAGGSDREGEEVMYSTNSTAATGLRSLQRAAFDCILAFFIEPGRLVFPQLVGSESLSAVSSS